MRPFAMLHDPAVDWTLPTNRPVKPEIVFSISKTVIDPVG